MIQTGLNIPNAFMLITILFGLIIDAIGALNFLFGTEIIFTIGSIIAAVGTYYQT